MPKTSRKRAFLATETREASFSKFSKRTKQNIHIIGLGQIFFMPFDNVSGPGNVLIAVQTTPTIIQNGHVYVGHARDIKMRTL
jgi:hypothetical protein